MLTLPPTVRLYVCTERVDMRKSFDGLAIAARELVGGDPLSGHLFFFFNRRGDICKAVWWSAGGYCLFGKRLAKGRFRVPAPPGRGKSHVELEAGELALLLAGIDLRDTRKRTRWSPRRKKNDKKSNSSLSLSGAAPI